MSRESAGRVAAATGQGALLVVAPFADPSARPLQLIKWRTAKQQQKAATMADTGTRGEQGERERRNQDRPEANENKVTHRP